MFAVIKMELSGKTVYGPGLKTTQLFAHAQNHAKKICNSEGCVQGHVTSLDLTNTWYCLRNGTR